MNENIDLTELLNGYPTGTKLYSKAFGTVTFDCIKSDKICIKDHKGIEIYYTKSAKYYYAEEDAEIDLFPSKDQRDWSKWHRPFVDGDIVATNDGKYIAIIKNNGGKYYVCCHPNVNYFHIDRSGWFDRLATEEEKATLFQAIKDNGYKWNAETNTLNKVIEPKFKVGDIITSKNGISMYKITNVTPEYYSTRIPDHACAGLLPVSDQDNWILIPNKFNPKNTTTF